MNNPFTKKPKTINEIIAPMAKIESNLQEHFEANNDAIQGLEDQKIAIEEEIGIRTEDNVRAHALMTNFRNLLVVKVPEVKTNEAPKE